MRISPSRTVLPVLCVAVILGAQAGLGQSKNGQFDVMETTIDKVEAAYKSGTFTSHQLVQIYLDRIAAYDKQGPAINCVIALNPKAMEEADRLDAELRKSGPVGPLHGIPILVKDRVDAAETPPIPGAEVFGDFKPPLDSFVVAKLRKAGAIILGTTTFGAGEAYGSLFGVTLDPYDLVRTVGVSSGGSGACLTAKVSAVAVGEEGSASIRQQATWNELVSMRPTPGLVSRAGMYDRFALPVASPSPMAGTVKDLSMLLDVMAGYDPDDPATALGMAQIPASYSRFLDKNGLKGARIGLIREPVGSVGVGTPSESNSEGPHNLDGAFNRAVAELKAAGAEVIDQIEIPNLQKLLAPQALNPGEPDENMPRSLTRNPDSPYLSREDVRMSRGMPYSIPAPNAQPWIESQKPEAAKYSVYLEASEQLKINILKVMAAYRLDAIVQSSIEDRPTLIQDGNNPSHDNRKRSSDLSTLVADAATVTVSAGFSKDGLPVGVTFFGTPYSEPMLLRLAYAYEQAAHHRISPKTAPPLAASRNLTSEGKSGSSVPGPEARND